MKRINVFSAKFCGKVAPHHNWVGFNYMYMYSILVIPERI